MSLNRLHCTLKNREFTRLLRNAKQLYHGHPREPSQPLVGRIPPIMAMEQAMSLIKSGDSVFIQGMAATPIALMDGLTEHGRKNDLRDVKIYHLYVEGSAGYNAPELKDTFRSVSLFTGANCRKAIADGRADYMPVLLSEAPSLFSRGIIKPNVSLVQVTPPDEHGYMSLGIGVDIVRESLKFSKYIIGQVNRNLPQTYGDSVVHESHFDALVECTADMPVIPPLALTDVEKAIGKLIAENLVEDGATLQIGIGGIPDAVLSACANHKDLGIHSEMISDGVVDLVSLGAVTNKFKKVEPGRLVAALLIGTQKLYSFANKNPSLVMRTADFVNKESVISQNPKVTAINSCIEVDLVGEVASDTIGPKVYSGFGGQLDFLRGAALSSDGKGKPILAMASSTNRGESKIVPFLKHGSGVVTTRAHIHYLVTEYGIAELFGKTYRQRAHALIQIAHPDHRESLEKAAFERLKCLPSPY